jgi:hypothetical protein
MTPHALVLVLLRLAGLWFAAQALFVLAATLQAIVQDMPATLGVFLPIGVRLVVAFVLLFRPTSERLARWIAPPPAGDGDLLSTGTTGPAVWLARLVVMAIGLLLAATGLADLPYAGWRVLSAAIEGPRLPWPHYETQVAIEATIRLILGIALVRKTDAVLRAALPSRRGAPPPA